MTKLRLRFPDQEYIPPPCRVIASAGVWAVPVNQRPRGWETLGVREPVKREPVKRERRTAPQTPAPVRDLAAEQNRMAEAARRFVSGVRPGGPAVVPASVVPSVVLE